MKEHYICFLQTDEELTDFFMVKTIAVKLGSNKKQYLDLLLCDNTGEITAKKWDVSDEELPSLQTIKENDVIKVKATVTEWNGMRQLRIVKLRRAVAQDGTELCDFIKAAPEKSEAMLAYIQAAVERMEDEELKTLCTKVLEDNREMLLYYPAAMKNHHAEMGGLLYHTKRMLMMGEHYCEVYRTLNRDLLIAGVVLHDIEKLNEIDADELGISTGYTFEGQMLGHIVQGICYIGSLCEALEIGREKTVMLEHMILSHHYEPEYGSPKRPLFPEAEALHYLDIVDARMYDMEAALRGVQPGEFSDRVWTLDNRKLYKAKNE